MVPIRPMRGAYYIISVVPMYPLRGAYVPSPWCLCTISVVPMYPPRGAYIPSPWCLYTIPVVPMYPLRGARVPLRRAYVPCPPSRPPDPSVCVPRDASSVNLGQVLGSASSVGSACSATSNTSDFAITLSKAKDKKVVSARPDVSPPAPPPHPGIWR